MADMLKEGMEVESITFMNGEGYICVNKSSTEKLVVTMVNGQMAETPWIAVYKYGETKPSSIHNCALIESIDFKGD